MRVLLAIGLVLLILKLVGVAQIAWWMVVVPFVLILLWVIFMGFMLSGFGTLMTISMMQKGHEANKRKLAKKAAKDA